MSISDAFLKTSKKLTKFLIAILMLIPLWVLVIYITRPDFFTYGILIPACLGYFVSMLSVATVIAVQFVLNPKYVSTFDSDMVDAVLLSVLVFSGVFWFYFKVAPQWGLRDIIESNLWLISFCKTIQVFFSQFNFPWNKSKKKIEDEDLTSNTTDASAPQP